MKWFKLYHDMPDDIKIRRFTAQEKWAWIVLLCLASKSKERGVILADNEDLADYCEFNSTQDFLYYRDKLIQKGMLEINADGNLVVLHWDDRQYEKSSDRPEAVRERVRKHRAKKKSEECNALHLEGNATETQSNAIDLDLDPDQDQDPPLTPPKNFGQVGPCHAGGDAIAQTTPDPCGICEAARPAESPLPVNGSQIESASRQNATPTGLGESSAAANFLDEKNNPPWRDEGWNFDERMVTAVYEAATGPGGAAHFKMPNGRPNIRNIRQHLRKLDKIAMNAGYSRRCNETLELLDYWEMATQPPAPRDQPERTSSHPAGVIFTAPPPTQEAASPEQIAEILRQARAAASANSTSRRIYAKRN